MRWVGLTAFVFALAFVAYGSWLVFTPDYDGGRRPVGALVLVCAVPLLLLSGTALVRRRSTYHR